MHRMSRVILCLAVVACATDPGASCTAVAGGLCWVRLGPDSTWVVSAATDNAGNLLIGTRASGIMRYRNGQWEPLAFPGKTITSLQRERNTPRLWATIAPVGPETTASVLYSSDNHGLTWSGRDGTIASDENCQALAFAFLQLSTNNQTLILSQSAQIARSTDGGANWSYVFGSPSDLGNGILRRAQSPAQPSRLWAAGTDATGTPFVLISSEHGATWQRRNTGGTAATDVIPDSLSPDQAFVSGEVIRRTQDAGATWSISLVPRSAGVFFALVEFDGALQAIGEENATGTPRLGMYSWRGGVWDSLQVPPSIAGGTVLLPLTSTDALLGTKSGAWRVRRQ